MRQEAVSHDALQRCSPQSPCNAPQKVSPEELASNAPRILHQLDDLLPGDHLCFVYDNDNDFQNIVSSYIDLGLQANQKFVYIYHYHDPDWIISSLRQVGLDLKPYLDSGQFIFSTPEQFYFQNDRFSPDAVTDLLARETQTSLAQGYTALRGLGEMPWAHKDYPGIERHLEYESRLNYFFAQNPCIAICSYDRRHYDDQSIIEILRTHPYAIIGSQIYDNIYYESPNAYLGHKNAGKLLDSWLETLKIRRQSRLLIEESERRYHAHFDSLPIPVFTVQRHDKDFFLVNANRKGHEFVAQDLERISRLPLKKFWRAYPDLYRDLEKAYLSGEPIVREHNYSHPSTGEEGTFVFSFVPVPGDFLMIHIEDVTETRRACNALAKSQASYKALAENLPGLVYRTHLERNEIEYLNNHLVEITGYQPHDLRRSRFSPLESIILKEDLSEVLRHTNRAITQKHSFSIEYRIRHRDGAIRHLQEWGRPVANEKGVACMIDGVIVDNTSKWEQEEALREGERRFHTMIDLTYDWEYWLNPDGSIVYNSPSCERITGYANLDFLENPGLLESILHPDDRPLWQRHIAREFEKPHQKEHLRFRVLNAGGDVRWVDHICQPVYDEQGQYRGRRASNRDITDQVEIEEQHRELERQLRHAQKMEAIGQLAGGVAHDFNNLLQVIHGSLFFAREDLDSTHPSSQHIKMVQTAADRAEELVRQLLAFSRRQVLQPRRQDLNKLLEGLLKMIRRIIGEHIELHFEPGRDLGLVEVDPGQIEQVIMNLCVNARDAMPEGGTLTIRTSSKCFDDTQCRSIRLKRPGQYNCIQVIDTGAGIDSATQEKIFEPFFTTKEQAKGTGLGLSTVYGIIRQHNGVIRVESSPGNGACFSFCLPQVDGEAEDAAPTQSTPLRGSNQTVLVVEDDPMVRRVAQLLLEQGGYRILTAENGEKALEIIEQQSDRIDLVLLDMIMPKMSGREVFAVLQARYPQLRILFTSGYSAEAISMEFLQNHDTKLLGKPYTAEKLLNAVGEALH